MNPRSMWERYYAGTSLGKIPWQKTQADYFTNVIKAGKVKPGSALDLGCGTGAKSIYLAKKGFKVTGIDISKTAIKLAKKNAQKAKAQVNFIVADVTGLSFLKNKKFDFVLDWANLHGIPKTKQKRYVTKIAKHTKKGGRLLLRCFSKRGIKREFAVRSMGLIYLFSKRDIEKLFTQYFKILETHKSKPCTGNPPGKWFDEYLMERLTS